MARSWHDSGEGSSVFESVPVDRPDIPSDLDGKGSERSFTSAISHGCHDVVYGRRCLGDIGSWLIGQSETLSVSRAISGQRSIPLIFLCVVVFHVSPRSSCNLRSNVNRGGRRRWYGSRHRLSRPSAMHELFLVPISVEQLVRRGSRPRCIGQLIDGTERKRGGSDVDAHAIPRRSPLPFARNIVHDQQR